MVQKQEPHVVDTVEYRAWVYRHMQKYARKGLALSEEMLEHISCASTGIYVLKSICVIQRHMLLNILILRLELYIGGMRAGERMQLYMNCVQHLASVLKVDVGGQLLH